jgi:oxaloacetate decarboxylase gamma subunit
LNLAGYSGIIPSKINVGGYMTEGMTIVEMLGQSGVLSLLGMGVVFGFLVILIIAVSLAGKVFHTLGLDKDVRAPVRPAVSAGPSTAAKTAAVTAAIRSAVAEYRKDERK